MTSCNFSAEPRRSLEAIFLGDETVHDAFQATGFKFNVQFMAFDIDDFPIAKFCVKNAVAAREYIARFTACLLC